MPAVKGTQPPADAKLQRQIVKARQLLNRLEDNDAIQLSDQMLRTRVRLLIPRAIKTLSELLGSDNPSIRVKAAQILLNKVMPDLKALSVENKQDVSGLVIVRHEDNSTVIDLTNTTTDRPITG